MQLAEPVLFSKPKIIQVRMPVDTIIQNLQLGYTILSDSLYDNCIAVHKEDLEHGHYQTGIYDIELTLKAQPKSSLTQKLFKSDESLVACNLDCNPFFGGSEFYLKFHSAFRLSEFTLKFTTKTKEDEDYVALLRTIAKKGTIFKATVDDFRIR